MGEMIKINAGSFMMGSPENELGRFDNEIQYEVVISQNFVIGKYPVTHGQWEEVMGYNLSWFNGKERPVENVSWYDAVTFCNALSRREGYPEAYALSGVKGKPGEDGYGFEVAWNRGAKGYRLPLEAEWEYACRAGTTTATYNGDLDVETGTSKVLEPIAWYNANSGDETHPVGQKRANAWGLQDTLGNVWEWGWDRNNYNNPAVRGGAWGDRARFARAANRDFARPAGRYRFIGFRLARTL